jgi:hypothetical protein
MEKCAVLVRDVWFYRAKKKSIPHHLNRDLDLHHFLLQLRGGGTLSLPRGKAHVLFLHYLLDAIHLHPSCKIDKMREEATRMLVEFGAVLLSESEINWVLTCAIVRLSP